MNGSERNKRLLETILAVRSSVREGLSDDDLTLLLLTTLLTDAGFGFLSFSRGLVTLTVPKQDLANWYPEQCWIAPEKEMNDRAIAEKYELSLSKPLDRITSYWLPAKAAELARHLIQMNDRFANRDRGPSSIPESPDSGKVRSIPIRLGSTVSSASRPGNPAGPISPLCPAMKPQHIVDKQGCSLNRGRPTQ